MRMIRKYGYKAIRQYGDTSIRRYAKNAIFIHYPMYLVSYSDSIPIISDRPAALGVVDPVTVVDNSRVKKALLLVGSV